MLGGLASKPKVKARSGLFLFTNFQFKQFLLFFFVTLLCHNIKLSRMKCTETVQRFAFSFFHAWKYQVLAKKSELSDAQRRVSAVHKALVQTV